MYPLTQSNGKVKSGFAWWLSKSSVIVIIAAAMPAVMLLALKLINNFSPVNWTKTIIVACMASLAFMCILYFFNVWMGKVGSFLMLIFMVVQLAGSAGTYPVEISGGFVAKIHKYLPFTYTVEAFRGTISGAGNISHAVIILFAISVIFSILTIMLFGVRAKELEYGGRTVYDIIEEKGLA
jgi:putative membrane protein